MFLHPHNQICLNLGASKRVNFWLSIQCFYVCTITLWRKTSKLAKILGHQKGSTFGSVYNVFKSAPSLYGKENPKLLKSWGIRKGQLLVGYTIFLLLHHHPMMKNIQIWKHLGAWNGELLAQCTMFWHLHYHSHGKKYQNLLKSLAWKGSTFS